MKKLLVLLSLIGSLSYGQISDSNDKDIYQQINRPLSMPFVRQLLFEIFEHTLIKAHSWHRAMDQDVRAILNLIEAGRIYDGKVATQILEEYKKETGSLEIIQKAEALFESHERSQTQQFLSLIIQELIGDLLKDSFVHLENKSFKEVVIHLMELRSFRPQELKIFGIDIDKDILNVEMFLEQNRSARGDVKKARQGLKNGRSFSEIVSGNGKSGKAPFYQRKLSHNLGVLLLHRAIDAQEKDHLPAYASFLEFSSQLRNRDALKAWEQSSLKDKVCGKSF